MRFEREVFDSQCTQNYLSSFLRGGINFVVP